MGLGLVGRQRQTLSDMDAVLRLTKELRRAAMLWLRACRRGKEVVL